MIVDVNVHLGRRLRRRRRVLGLTQTQLAERLGVGFQQIQKYECGANKMSAMRLWQLAEALEAPIGYFYDGLPTAAIVSEPELIPQEGEGQDLLQAYMQLKPNPRRKLLRAAKALIGLSAGAEAKGA